MSTLPASRSAVERESFFDAINRHRRTAWRVTAASVVADALVAFLVATLMAPLFYALLAIGFDLANLFAPVPNLVRVVGEIIGPAFDSPTQLSLEQWLRLAL